MVGRKTCQDCNAIARSGIIFSTGCKREKKVAPYGCQVKLDWIVSAPFTIEYSWSNDFCAIVSWQSRFLPLYRTKFYLHLPPTTKKNSFEEIGCVLRPSCSWANGNILLFVDQLCIVNDQFVCLRFELFGFLQACNIRIQCCEMYSFFRMSYWWFRILIFIVATNDGLHQSVIELLGTTHKVGRIRKRDFSGDIW